MKVSSRSKALDATPSGHPTLSVLPIWAKIVVQMQTCHSTKAKVMKSEFFDVPSTRGFRAVVNLGVRPEISAGYFVTAWCCDDEVGHFGGRAFVGGRAAGLRRKRHRAQAVTPLS